MLHALVEWLKISHLYLIACHLFNRKNQTVFKASHSPRIFAGWMFASSPALSALEHPVYDVWVIDCQ